MVHILSLIRDVFRDQTCINGHIFLTLVCAVTEARNIVNFYSQEMMHGFTRNWVFSNFFTETHGNMFRLMLTQSLRSGYSLSSFLNPFSPVVIATNIHIQFLLAKLSSIKITLLLRYHINIFILRGIFIC